MPGTITLKSKSVQQQVMDDQQPKTSSLVSHVLPHQYDSISSAAGADSELAISKSHAGKASAGSQSYYQDTLSAYNDDPMSRLLSVANRTSQPKHSTSQGVADLQKVATEAPPAVDFDKAYATVKRHHQEALAKAGKQTQEIIEQSRTQSDGTKSTLEQRLEQLSQAIDAELSKDNINFDALQALVLKAVMLHMRKTARVEHEYISELGVQIRAKAQIVKDAYASKTQLGVTLVVSVIGLGGGVGLAPLMTNSISQATANAVVQTSQIASSSSSAITSLVAAKDNSTKGHHEFHLRLMQNNEDNAKTRERGNGEVIKSLKSLIDEFVRSLHQLFSTFS